MCQLDGRLCIGMAKGALDWEIRISDFPLKHKIKKTDRILPNEKM